jgi:hypothetical protein
LLLIPLFFYSQISFRALLFGRRPVLLDLLQKSVFNTALGGVPAAGDGDESAYARTLLMFVNGILNSNPLVVYQGLNFRYDSPNGIQMFITTPNQNSAQRTHQKLARTQPSIPPPRLYNQIKNVITQPTGSGGVQKMVSSFFEHPTSKVAE